MLASNSWDDLYEEQNADVAYQILLRVISSSSSFKYFPIGSSIKNCNQGFNKTWFTVGLLKVLRKKNKLYRKYVLNPTHFTHGVYKSYRNKYINSIRHAKKM